MMLAYSTRSLHMKLMYISKRDSRLETENHTRVCMFKKQFSRLKKQEKKKKYAHRLVRPAPRNSTPPPPPPPFHFISVLKKKKWGEKVSANFKIIMAKFNIPIPIPNSHDSFAQIL